MKLKKPLKYLLAVFVTSFLINLFWEVGHSPLYDWTLSPLQNNVYYYVPAILFSAFGDAFIISVLFMSNSLMRGGIKWLSAPKIKDYLTFMLTGLVCAVIIETVARLFHFWSYLPSMPIIMGIGVSPLVQLALTGILTIYCAKHYTFVS
jgi:hypothetical protein